MNVGLISRSAVGVLLALGTASCATAPSPQSCQIDHTSTGAAVGAAAGAGLGLAVAAASNSGAGGMVAAGIGGAIIGGVLGAMAGKQQDQACHELALKQALDRAIAQNEAANARLQSAQASQSARRAAAQSTDVKYQSVDWANSVTKNTGSITPIAAVAEAPANQVCMTYYDQQTSSGQTQAVAGKACRGPDGEWKPAT